MSRRRCNADGTTTPGAVRSDMANKQNLTIIPYDRGLFYFAPEYLATAEAWQTTFQGLTKNILLENGCSGKIADAHGYSITVGWGALELVIDARLGTFAVWENEESDDDECISNSWSGHEIVPDRFLDELHSAPIPDHLAGSIFEHIVPFTNAILRKMTGALEQALAEKRIEIRYFPTNNSEQNLTLSDLNELYEPVSPILEKLFFVVLPRSTSANFVSKGNAVGNLTRDARFKHDWKKIDLLLKEEYARIRMKPFRTRTELKNAVEGRLGEKSPNPGMMFKRIKHVIPNF
jgi:hypothetical protein